MPALTIFAAISLLTLLGSLMYLFDSSLMLLWFLLFGMRNLIVGFHRTSILGGGGGNKGPALLEMFYLEQNLKVRSISVQV